MNIDHQIIDAVEIDEKAMKAYNSIHSTKSDRSHVVLWAKELPWGFVFLRPLGHRLAVEIDEKAMKAYNSIHSTKFENQDIQKWDKNLECDYLHASRPCQAFSTAGTNVGADAPRGNSWWHHTLRIIKRTEARFVPLENVKGSVSKKHRNLLDCYLNEMEKLGFKNTWKI